MSLFDFFFPEQAQASLLRTLVNENRRKKRRETLEGRTLEKAEDRIEALENDLGFVALLLGSLLAKLDEKGVLTRQDVKDAMPTLDGADGVADGKLDIRVLRGMQH
ncbi:MAG: hypothetical protein INH34_02230 [Phycisphaerales bacterium]|jgi:hypothetical protein|nr:hypothetical protein [Phycisphaerales bacterium]